MTVEVFHSRHAPTRRQSRTAKDVQSVRNTALGRHQFVENTASAHYHHDHLVHWKSHGGKTTARGPGSNTWSNRVAASPTSARHRTRPCCVPEQSPSHFSTRLSSRKLTRTDCPLSPHQSARKRQPAVVSDDEEMDEAVWGSPRSKNLYEERDLSCVSFAETSKLSAIHFRSRESAYHARDSSRTQAPQAVSLVLQKDSRVLNRDQSSDRVKTARKKDRENETLFSFFDDDDESDFGLSADMHHDIQKPAAAHKSKLEKKCFLGKYSKSLLCIIPKCSSAIPSTSASCVSSDYQIHMNDDDEEIEVTFSSAYSEESNTSLCNYSLLLQDSAYLHAQQAGFLWQSLVGQHLRFPRHWWDGRRSPPLGNNKEELPWHYVGSCSTRNHPSLKKIVQNRASSGRLLLHVLVRDANNDIVCDLAVGCYHPNARGIRQNLKADPLQESTRQVWLAVRKRRPCSVIDSWLQSECRSPIGKSPITNENLLAVYGDKAPLETLFLCERDLACLVVSAPKSCPPALVLCESYVFD